MEYRYIAVEGNIGAGKTTLASMLAKHYDARLVLEEFADNTFLPKFYAEPDRYAFPLELSFLADRYKQLKALLAMPDMFGRPLISDYTFFKSKLFARVNLKDEEYNLFQTMFDIIDPQLAPPEVLIYLNAPIPKLQQNIRRRGREYEQSIPDAYLDRVQDVYQQFLKQNYCKTLVIDVTEVDFLNNAEHFRQLTDFLNEPCDFKVQQLVIG